LDVVDDVFLMILGVPDVPDVPDALWMLLMVLRVLSMRGSWVYLGTRGRGAITG
jgi:hypothetical protein